MKTFYSVEDIENLVAQGVRELQVDEDSVLTDVARDAAVRMGLKLTPKGRSGAGSVAPVPTHAATPGTPARPRGCQHGPLGGHGQATAPATARAGSAQPTGGIVDDLVGAVRQLAGKGSTGSGGA